MGAPAAENTKRKQTLNEVFNNPATIYQMDEGKKIEKN